VAQVVEHLHSKHKDMSSNPSTKKKTSMLVRKDRKMNFYAVLVGEFKLVQSGAPQKTKNRSTVCSSYTTRAYTYRKVSQHTIETPIHSACYSTIHNSQEMGVRLCTPKR
jgi:hypothetical protein